MLSMQVNMWAVIVSAIASMVIGSITYGPLFGKVFAKAMGFDQLDEAKRKEMMKGMTKMYVLQFIASLVMMYVLAVLMANLGMLSLAGGLVLALWVWIGFGVPWKLGEAIWGGKMVLFWIGIFNTLITLLVAGAIIGSWL